LAIVLSVLLCEGSDYHLTIVFQQVIRTLTWKDR
jgi:hypothetical protein